MKTSPTKSPRVPSNCCQQFIKGQCIICSHLEAEAGCSNDPDLQEESPDVALSTESARENVSSNPSLFPLCDGRPTTPKKGKSFA